uniref:NR LBD domain-containing protein n=1 Tax=Caenorhabditis japonica TaxID=281687 RepID=A0A8R1HNL7_CAEJA
MFLPSGDYIDLKHLDSYYNNNLEEFSQTEIVSMSAKQFDVLSKCITDSLNFENVDLYEFLTLTALILWESDLDSDIDRPPAQDEALQFRSTIMRELIIYYQSINSYEDVALRLGKVLLILANIQRASHRFHKYIEIKNLLDLYALPRNLFDLFTPVS